ncbi:MAG: efflux RND transporter permease subunit, partial [Candidatus Binatia bacterium]
ADALDVRPLMETPPTTPAQIAALKAALEANPVYLNTVVSTDWRTAALVVEFKDPHEAGHRSILQAVQAVIEKERDPSVDIVIGGTSVFLAQLELYSERMIILVPLAILLIGLIHFEAFRTLQGLFLPLMTAILAVVWGLGIMGLSGVPVDGFSAMTPILILAVAAGHAVQILKRYYEEYHHLRHTTELSPHDANRLAVVQSITAVGPVMLTAGITASLGFLSLTAFEIRAIKTFGIFAGIGILSALTLEMTFIPALRSWLTAPGEREAQRERAHTVWDRITGAIATLVTGPQRLLVAAATAVLVVVGLVGMSRIVIDNNNKEYFAPSAPFIQDDETLNTRLGGTVTLYVLIEGQSEDTIKDPAVLKAIDATQTFIARQPHVGKTISLADFVKRLNQAMNGNDPAAYRIPDTRELIAQYLLLYSMSGEPGDFDAYVDYGYTSTVLAVFMKTDSSLYANELMAKISAYARAHLPPQVRFSFGGTVPTPAAFNEDGRGKNPLLKNSFFYLVAGGDRTFLEYCNINLQYFLRVVSDFHNPLAVSDPLRMGHNLRRFSSPEPCRGSLRP